MRFSVLFTLSLVSWGQAGSPGYFVPTHRISGVGVERDDLSADVLQARTELMIQSQTFGIMREQEALAGAKRITTDPKLQPLFRDAAASSGFPATILEAIAYLESWGDAKAESPAGPKGIMQISEATAHDMGLKVVHATRYKVTREKVQVKSKSKKPKFKTVTHKTPYTLTVRDDRLAPARAIPAAARYLAGIERKFDGQDWAIFAYHCGTGCVAEMMELTRRARGIPQAEITVPRMFFSCSPSWNRELYQAIQQQMLRDYSPTYYFRIQRAAQLLALYRRDPAAFLALQEEFRNQFSSGPRAPHRLSAWLKRDDLIYRTAGDIRAGLGARLVQAPDQPAYLGYSLRLSPPDPAGPESFSEATPAALGALAYVAFETRRLYLELGDTGQPFQPLPVTSLVEPEDHARVSPRHEALAHASGQVFDVDYSALPPGEQECLRFVLNDLGWDGCLGFVEDGADILHIGCSPASRDFFAVVFQEAVDSNGFAPTGR
jgi:hypothetical protein